MTPKELHDYVVVPLKEAFEKRLDSVDSRLDRIEQRVEGNTSYRWSLYGGVAVAAIVATAAASKLFI